MDEVKTKKVPVFNSSLEIALRLLFILSSTSKFLDLQRLIYYNYLIVHSSDIPDSPQSIHADLPLRSCEMLVNRGVVKDGLTILVSKDLIEVKYSKEGILYTKNNNTEMILENFQSTYSALLEDRANWLCSTFDKMTDRELSSYMDENLGKWGSEFSAIYDYSDDT